MVDTDLALDIAQDILETAGCHVRPAIPADGVDNWENAIVAEDARDTVHVWVNGDFLQATVTRHESGEAPVLLDAFSVHADDAEKLGTLMFEKWTPEGGLS